MNIQDLSKKTSKTLLEYGVTKAALFGSHARGDATPSSDIDMLVEFGRQLSLLDFVGLKLDLEDALDTKVDLVQYKLIKPSIKEYILKDEKVFFQT